jgi:hypothetical protein
MPEVVLMNGDRCHDLGGLPFDEFLEQPARNLRQWRHPNPVNAHPPRIARSDVRVPPGNRLEQMDDVIMPPVHPGALGQRIRESGDTGDTGDSFCPGAPALLALVDLTWATISL